MKIKFFLQVILLANKRNGKQYWYLPSCACSRIRSLANDHNTILQFWFCQLLTDWHSSPLTKMPRVRNISDHLTWTIPFYNYFIPLIAMNYQHSIYFPPFYLMIRKFITTFSNPWIIQDAPFQYLDNSL